MKQNCKQIKKLMTRRKERLSRHFWLPQKNTLPVKKKNIFLFIPSLEDHGSNIYCKRIMKIRNKTSLRRWWDNTGRAGHEPKLKYCNDDNRTTCRQMLSLYSAKTEFPHQETFLGALNSVCTLYRVHVLSPSIHVLSPSIRV